MKLSPSAAAQAATPRLSPYLQKRLRLERDPALFPAITSQGMKQRVLPRRLCRRISLERCRANAEGGLCKHWDPAKIILFGRVKKCPNKNTVLALKTKSAALFSTLLRPVWWWKIMSHFLTKNRDICSISNVIPRLLIKLQHQCIVIIQFLSLCWSSGCKLQHFTCGFGSKRYALPVYHS